MRAAKTAQAVDAAILANAEPPHRRHLGASIIGQPCARRIWYAFRWTLAEQHEARLLRLFNRGHLEERRFIAYLRNAGVEVWEAGEAGDMKSSMRLTGHGGHYGGTPDGVGRGLPDLPANVPFLLEFKTHNDKSFAKLVEDGLMKAKWEHFVQMQQYMMYHRLEYGLYCAVNKDTDALEFQLVRYDAEVAQRFFERAGQIIWSNEPPVRINNSPGYYLCKFCHFNRLCHFGDVAPERNCRTCVHARPIEGGLWQCNFPLPPGDILEPQQLDETAQRAACPHYEVNPVFVGKQP